MQEDSNEPRMIHRRNTFTGALVAFEFELLNDPAGPERPKLVQHTAAYIFWKGFLRKRKESCNRV
jgi:hypothetical protein